MLATFPHEQVQTLVGDLASHVGHSRVYRAIATILLLAGTGLTVAVVRTLSHHPQRRILGLFWFATLILMIGAWWLLMANNVELVHYIQYVLPGPVLFALTVSPLEALSWITVMGGLDECFQYWGLYGARSVPYDFNDVYMDVLGGAAGILLGAICIGHAKPRREPWGVFLNRIANKPGVQVICAILSTAVILWASGKMLLYRGDPRNHSYWFTLSRMPAQGFWFFSKAWGPRTIHSLSPVEGPLLILLTLIFYATLDRRLLFIPFEGSKT
jgi:hypothetical protein